MSERSRRDRAAQRVLIGEGLANASVLGAKTAVGLSTGSAAVLGDAVHSLADLANNGIALVATRVAELSAQGRPMLIGTRSVESRHAGTMYPGNCCLAYSLMAAADDSSLSCSTR